MARAPRAVTPEAQLEADMIELVGYPAFRRLLFTVMQRSGMCSVAYGTEVATSYHEGRRSLGIDILRMADNALSVNSADSLPFAAMALAISEGMRSNPQETQDADEGEDQYADDALERR